jgi:8-oxo-dGTP diphosphatase
VDDVGRIFFQRRSARRKLFPDTWDIVGGYFHVRADGALRRPRWEVGRHAEFRPLGPHELDALDESPELNDGMIRQIAEDGFAVLCATGR